MRTRRPPFTRCNSGQSMVEIALMLPLLLMVVLNAVNFGYFFLVAMNLAAAPRSGVEYAIIGNSTPVRISLPLAGPRGAAGVASVSTLTNQDMAGALSAPATNASIQVCSTSSDLGPLLNAGTPSARAPCATFEATTPVGFTFPAAQPDPELNSGNTAPAFVLTRVDVAYKFKPLIQGTPFNITLLASPICSSASGSVTCTFHRQASMRAMN